MAIVEKVPIPLVRGILLVLALCHCRLTVGGTSRPLRNRRNGRAGGWACLSALQKDCLRMTVGRWSSETPCVMLDLLPPAQHAASHFAKEENEPQVKWLATQVTHLADARCWRTTMPHSCSRVFLRAAAVSNITDICLIASSDRELTPKQKPFPPLGFQKGFSHIRSEGN